MRLATVNDLEEEETQGCRDALDDLTEIETEEAGMLAQALVPAP